MRIGIDAREICGKPTGVGRHLAGLLDQWGTNARDHEFVLYAPEPPAIVVPDNMEVALLPGGRGTAWEQVTLATAANRARLDVFFAPGYSAPLRLVAPSVVLVHDLSFLAHPEWFRMREGLRRRQLTRWSSQRAHLVLAVSESARAEIVERLSLPSRKVRCIYPGISTLRIDGGPREREPLVLFVGSVFNRRHVPELIEAFAIVWKRYPDARMEIVGDNRTYPHQAIQSIAAAEGVLDRITFRPWVDDARLAELYARAGAFAFLSEYEGFGHPPLEALAVGVPPILLDTNVARETCGDAAVFVRCQVGSIATALEEALFDRQTRDRILAAAPGVLGRYSWETAARQTLDALREAGATRG